MSQLKWDILKSCYSHISSKKKPQTVSNIIPMSAAFMYLLCRWHEGETHLAPTGHGLIYDIKKEKRKKKYIICLNPEGWLGTGGSSSPKCHPIMSSGQRCTVRTAPAGTWDAHWLAFYPTAIWTTPAFFVDTAVRHLHPNKKFQLCAVSFCPGDGLSAEWALIN